MKNTYCFALGTNHSLCKAEILSVLYQKGIEAGIVAASKETLILQTGEEIDAGYLINEMGSTAKIIKIIDSVPFQDTLKNFSEKFSDPEFNKLFFPENEKYILLGISVYGSGGKFKNLNNAWYLTPKIIQNIRKSISSQGKSSGFIPLKERILSTVSFDKNNLLKKGFELVLCVVENEILIGKTLAVQDYESYSFRDFQRPKKDIKSGMIPLKVARMMINLAKKGKDAKLLDPFCGSGTFLQEELMLGYKYLFGTDILNKSVNDTKANIDWLYQNFPSLNGSDVKITLKESDVKTVKNITGENTIDAIISEPYLGSSQIKQFNKLQLLKEIDLLKKNYLGAFRKFINIIKQSGTIVIVFPVFRFDNFSYFLEILDEISKIGFEVKSFLPEIYQKDQKVLNLEITPRGSIIYYRPDQTVLREIFIFSRKQS